MTLKRTAIARGTSGLTRTTPFSRTTGLRRGSSTLDRGVGLSRKTRLAPVSDRRRIENDGPWKETKRIVDERDGGRCQIGRFFPEHRCSLGRHPHHVLPVGCGGDRLDADGVATVCRSGHDWIHCVIGWQAFKVAWDGRGAA
jgi:hypothetical protein